MTAVSLTYVHARREMQIGIWRNHRICLVDLQIEICQGSLIVVLIVLNRMDGNIDHWTFGISVPLGTTVISSRAL